LGHKVKVSDLYAMNFKAIADHDDFQQRGNEEFIKYQIEQGHASKTSGFSPDIQEEQEKLLWADFVIFQFPLWWYSVPAILKGWFDRVFASGFVYGKEIGRYDSGGLRGRRAMLSTTTGSPEHHIPRMGWTEIFTKRYCTISITECFILLDWNLCEPFIAWTAAWDEDARNRYFEEYKRRLHNRNSLYSISSVFSL
jgi:NAD(P)H dehydrogenase (quinone)